MGRPMSAMAALRPSISFFSRALGGTLLDANAMEMQESYTIGRTAIEGRANYGRFRRFGVSTEEQFQKVALIPELS
jgi:hypothetical protein